jgi:uncharacterized protein (DUF433 family)
MGTLTLDPVNVPLRRDTAGVIRVGESRVLLGLVIGAFRNGATPEAIVQSYDTLKLSDVYAVLAYYLTHQQEVDAYLLACDEEAQIVRSRIQAGQPDRSGLRQRLIERAKSLENKGAPTAQ